MDYPNSYALPHRRAMSSCRDLSAPSQVNRAIAEGITRWLLSPPPTYVVFGQKQPRIAHNRNVSFGLRAESQASPQIGMRFSPDCRIRNSVTCPLFSPEGILNSSVCETASK